MEPSNTTSLVYNYWPCYIAIYMKLTRCSQNIPKNNIGQPLIHFKYYITCDFGNDKMINWTYQKQIMTENKQIKQIISMTYNLDKITLLAIL